MIGPDDRGLSGEHIELCAEGARRFLTAESLRQTDRDAKKGKFARLEAVLAGLLFFCKNL